MIPTTPITREEVLQRASALLPRLRERAARTEQLRRMPEETIADFVAALIDAGLDDAHRQLLAHAIVGMAESASRRWVASGATEPASVAASRVADLAWAGLRAVHR